ncbi:phage gene 29 protein family protein [Williamsia sp.]|uniref:phage gene 29 protein family protein n=1 Tax=Williamsia sp. TaxID=1872085 RepID=UPI002F9385ED
MTYPGEPGYEPYSPGKAHKWAEYFKDIPLEGQWVGRGRTRVWVPSSRGPIQLPQTHNRLAEHLELIGGSIDPSKARIVRVGPTRGGSDLTSFGTWQDIKRPLPDVNPVAEAKQALAGLTPAELRQLVDETNEHLDELR